MPVGAANGSSGVEQILPVLQVEDRVARVRLLVPGRQVHDQVTWSGEIARGEVGMETEQSFSVRYELRREYIQWHSPSLGRGMELLAFGHAGFPVVVLPTSGGRFFEYEDRGMIAALTPKIDRGELQVICVDSVDQESWYNK